MDSFKLAVSTLSTYRNAKMTKRKKTKRLYFHSHSYAFAGVESLKNFLKMQRRYASCHTTLCIPLDSV